MLSLRNLCAGAILSCMSSFLFGNIGAEEQKNFSIENNRMFEISTYSTDQIIPLMPLLKEWVKREYIHYPYLWVPNDEEYSMDMFVKEKQALVIIARHQGRVVGVAAGMVFDSVLLQSYFQQSLLEKTKEQGLDPSQIFYMSFFLTAEEYRNHEQLVGSIYARYSAFAQMLGKTKMCYWTDLGTSKHPLKPEKLIAIEPWGHAIHGFKSMDLKVDFSWPTLQPDGSVKNETHNTEFFIREL